MPRYEIINASDSVFSAASEKGDGMVQPNTRRVLELTDDYSEARLESFASSGIFIKKTNSAAQNGQPLPQLDEQIALSRNRLMVAAGQEREEIVAELWSGKPSKASAKAASGSDSSATTAAPSATPAPAAASAATTAPSSSRG